MPQFLIERQIPGAGQLTGDQLQQISKKSCGVIHDMNTSGKDVQWVHSYVTGEKIFCIYNAPDADAGQNGRSHIPGHASGGTDVHGQGTHFYRVVRKPGGDRH